MKRALSIATVLLAFVALSGRPANLPKVEAKDKRESFSALAYLPNDRSWATANLTISLERSTLRSWAQIATFDVRGMNFIASHYMNCQA
jgi:hypothetical protein